MLSLITYKLKKFLSGGYDTRTSIVYENPKPITSPPVTRDIPKQQQALFETFPFIHYLKGRLIDAIDEETGERWTGHVAMFYRDTGRIRIDWDNGATTYHQLGEDSMWLFKLAKKGEG